MRLKDQRGQREAPDAFSSYRPTIEGERKVPESIVIKRLKDIDWSTGEIRAGIQAKGTGPEKRKEPRPKYH